MQRLSTAFNLSLMYLTPQMLNGVGQVMVLDSTDGASNDFHPKGIYSTEVFGRIGDERRNYRFGYIDIKADIFHPLIYTSIVKLKRMYGDIMASKTYAVWSDVEKDFIKATPAVGARTGYAFFLEHWKDIKFRESKSSTRMDMIALIEKNKEIAMTNKILIMPAGLRDLEIDDYGRRSEDEVNALYRRFIALSNVIVESSLTTNPEVVNKTRMDMQLNFVALYDMIESLIKGKKKLFLGKVASRRIFNGTRNVITAMDTSVPELGMDGAPGFNSTILGLYQYSMGTLPMTTAHVRQFLNPMFPSIDSPAQLVDPRTLQAKEVFLGSRQYDRWATNEGVEKVVGSFKEETLRNVPLKIDGYYLGLLYMGPDGTFKVMHDIRELPPERSKDHVRPLTLTDLLYLSVYRHFSKFPLFVTRYPVTGIGSIYPSRTHLRVTVNYEQRKRLDENWTVMGDEWTAHEFPMQGAAFVNSLIPHSAHLARLGADFDGDTSSANIAYSDQAQREMESFFKTKRGYIGTDGRLLFSCNVDTVDLVMFNMTGDPEDRPAALEDIKEDLTGIVANELYQEESDSTFTHWGVHYSVNKAIELTWKSKPTVVPMKDLKWNEMDGLDTERVERSDVEIPLIAVYEDGRYYVVDGNHRLKKLISEGATDVAVRILTGSMLEKCRVTVQTTTSS